MRIGILMARHPRSKVSPIMPEVVELLDEWGADLDARSAGDGDDRRLRGGFDLRGVTLVCQPDIVDVPASRELNHRVHLKYVTERGLELDPIKRYLATDDVMLRLRPTKVSSWDLRNTE